MRRSSGGWSSATRKPKPTVTADVPSGSISSASSSARRQRPAPRRRWRPAASTADARARSTVATTANASELRTASMRRDEERCRRRARAERAVEVEAVARRRRQRALDEHGSGTPRSSGHDAERRADHEARSPPPRGRRAVARPRTQPLRDRAPLLAARASAEQHREHRDDLDERERGRDRAGRTARGLAVDLDLERRVRGPPSSSTTPNDVNVNRNTIDAAAAIGGREQRQRHLAEGPRRATRRASAPPPPAAGRGAPRTPPTVRTTTAKLKKTWATQDRPTPCCQCRNASGPPGRSSARNAAPTTTVGSTNGTVTNARTEPPAGKSKRATTYAPGSPTDERSAPSRRRLPQREPRHARGTPGSVSTSRPADADRPSGRAAPRIAATGHTKNTARNASGTATPRSREPRGRAPSRQRSTTCRSTP